MEKFILKWALILPTYEEILLGEKGKEKEKDFFVPVYERNQEKYLQVTNQKGKIQFEKITSSYLLNCNFDLLPEDQWVEGTQEVIYGFKNNNSYFLGTARDMLKYLENIDCEGDNLLKLEIENWIEDFT